MFVYLCEIYIECITVFWIKENWRKDIKVEWRNTRLQFCCYGHFLLQVQYHFQILKLKPNWKCITGLQWKPSRYPISIEEYPFCKIPIYYIIFWGKKSYISNLLQVWLWLYFVKLPLDISLNYVTLLL